eukprot:EG_transcript_8994
MIPPIHPSPQRKFLVWLLPRGVLGNGRAVSGNPAFYSFTLCLTYASSQNIYFISFYHTFYVTLHYKSSSNCLASPRANCRQTGRRVHCSMVATAAYSERLIRRQTALQLQLLVKRLDGIPDEEPQEDLGVMEVRVAALQEAID